MTRALAAPSPLRDGEVALLPIDGDVTALIVAASHDPEITRWTQVPAGPDIARREPAHRGLDDAELDDRAVPGLRRWAWRRPGMATVWIDAADEAEVGYWLLAAARGRGIARRALRLLCTWSFEVCRLERLQLTTLPGNVASERVAQACGFHREGTLSRDVKGTSSTLQLWVRLTGDAAVRKLSAL